MHIGFIGKFKKLHDEEYIARGFEMLGHKVSRIPQTASPEEIKVFILSKHPDILLFTKWDVPELVKHICQLSNVKTVCWLFDLYFGYTREHQVGTRSFFQADYVFTTDNGHNHRWGKFEVNHNCVRQGIYGEECFVSKPDCKRDVIFVGSESPVYPERNLTMQKLANQYNFQWFGRKDADEIRGADLNFIFSKAKIVVGDSFYSPHYWSNRVVETLGRGGFLIHRDVPGLKEEYPDLVTYDGTYEDLCEKIDYYLEHEEERLLIVQKNFELVKNNYTVEKKCQELLNYIS